MRGKLKKVVETGIVVKDLFVNVLPLVQPMKKVIISNVLPFIKDELPIRELSRHGKVASQMKSVFAGCKSNELKHVVCFRRQFYMILNNKDVLN